MRIPCEAGAGRVHEDVKRSSSVSPGSIAPVLLLLGLVAGTADQASAQEERPHQRAARVESAPELDGNVLDDPAWTTAVAASEFWQTRPYAGEPASERTEVRVVFDATTLYIGVVCHDREPDRLVISDARRDSPLDDTDSFQMIFDSFRDGQNGFVFGTNPAGIEYDGQLQNDPTGDSGTLSGGRFGGGSGSGFNVNWDGVWKVAAKTGDYGWSAEFAIPFATLRYPQDDGAVWGLNFQRIIRRRNELSYWSKLEQQWGLFRLANAGLLEDVETPSRRHLEITPYVLATARRPSTGSGDREEDSEAGGDLKYGVTPSLTLDATYNTDFAQVEVDEQQVNLDRFNLFFPEKRPFFLENAGLFTVGASGEAELFFSRRIGIADDGSPIPIVGGGRLSGKIGRTNLGLLAMRTDEEGPFHANDYAVARLSRELPNRSNLGAIYVERQGTGDLALDGDRNRSLGLDGKLGIGERQQISAWAARTDTPGVEDDDHAYNAEWRLSSEDWLAFVDYLEVAPSFNPEVGFLARSDIRKPSAVILRRIRPENWHGIHELRPHVSYTGFWDFDGYQETEFVHVDNHFEWRNGYELHTGYNFTYEGVKEAFEIAPDIFVPTGEYSNGEAQIVFMTDQGDPISFSTSTIVGGFFGGDRVSAASSLRVRRNESLTSELTWNWNDVDLPTGDFAVNLGRLRLSYAPTPRLLLQLLTQYNDRTDRISSNVRFSWLRRANTGLYVVYDEIGEIGDDPLFARPDRSLIVKYSYLFDVFR